MSDTKTPQENAGQVVDEKPKRQPRKKSGESGKTEVAKAEQGRDAAAGDEKKTRAAAKPKGASAAKSAEKAAAKTESAPNVRTDNTPENAGKPAGRPGRKPAAVKADVTTGEAKAQTDAPAKAPTDAPATTNAQPKKRGRKPAEKRVTAPAEAAPGASGSEPREPVREPVKPRRAPAKKKPAEAAGKDQPDAAPKMDATPERIIARDAAAGSPAGTAAGSPAGEPDQTVTKPRSRGPKPAARKTTGQDAVSAEAIPVQIKDKPAGETPEGTVRHTDGEAVQSDNKPKRRRGHRGGKGRRKPAEGRQTEQNVETAPVAGSAQDVLDDIDSAIAAVGTVAAASGQDGDQQAPKPRRRSRGRKKPAGEQTAATEGQADAGQQTGQNHERKDGVSKNAEQGKAKSAHKEHGAKREGGRGRHDRDRESARQQVAARIAADQNADRELIINVASNEITIALLEDKQLVELNKEKCRTGFAVGDIYLGKVRKIMPGLNAAFVNVGHEKDAFVHYLDLGPQFSTLHKLTGQITSGKQAPKFENLKLDQPINKKGKISGLISSGQQILVQIAKEAISTKGPRLTSDISLAGRHVVLIPLSNKVSISQKIRSNEEKRRLKKIVDEVLPHNYGVIIRTAAQGKSDTDIANDITSLVTRWESALAKLKGAQPPEQLLSEMNRATTIIRDLLNGSFSSIIVDDKSMYEEIKEYIKTIAPEKEKIVKLYKGRVPVFDNYDISKQIKSLFAKYVSLKKGAYLIVEHTEAMHVVDVNSGNRAKVEDDQERTAMEVNLAAAAEIARQLRLRDMGGIIVIDFIDLHRSENRNVLHDRMTQLMATDRAKHTILPLSKFGLMQITRQRVRPEAIAEETEACPACGGTGVITPTLLLDQQIESKVAYFVDEHKLKFIKLRVSPYVEAFLKKGLPSKRRQWAARYGVKIKVVSDQSTGFVETKFFDKDDNELV